MTVFIDNNYICHADNADGRRAVEVSALDGMCALKVETYRYIPTGERWGAFSGEALLPAADPRPSDVVQKQYEADEAARLAELGIPQESNYTATRRYTIGSFLSVFGEIYEVISIILNGAQIIPGSNVCKSSVEEYINKKSEE